MVNWGKVPASSTLPFFFDTFDSNGASVTLTGLAATDIEVYKGTSMTQRTSDNGYTLLDTDGIDLDSRTGIHGFSIDLSDNSDAGFYAAGSFYTVVVDAVTIDSQTVRFVAGTFYIDDAIDLSDIQSHLTKVYSDTTAIHSDTTIITSDVAEVDTSDIRSAITIVASQVLIIKSDTSDIKSHLTVIASDIVSHATIISDIQSDTNKLVSDATEVDTSDIHSLLTLVRSDTAVIESVTSDIQSDTNVLITKTRGMVIATGTIGATGNTTTALHLDNAVFDSLSDDELNGYMLVLYDNSADEYHTRTIADWTNTGDLATVSTLPFTPEASVDLYWVLPPQSGQTPELDGDVSDVLSRLTVTNSQVLIIKSDTSDIKSNLVVIASDAAAIDSNVDKVYSDTTIIYSDTTTIQSDTTTLASDLAEGDFSDILSRLTVTNSQVLIIKSDTSDIKSNLTALTGAGGVISDIASGVDAIQAAGGALTAAQDSMLTQIHSDTQPVGTLFEIVSDIYSDTTVIEAGGGSLTATQASQLARVQSIAIVIEPYTSDTVSMVTIIKSDTSDIKSHLVVIQSETTAIQSDTTAVESKTSSLTYTVAGQVDANIQYVNDVQVDGVGTSGDPWGPV